MARSRLPMTIRTRGVEQIVCLLLGQPVPYSRPTTLDTRNTFDRRRDRWLKQLVVGHLAGELADGRKPQVDRRGRQALCQEQGPVLSDERLGESWIRARAPDPSEEPHQTGPVGAPGVFGGQPVKHQADQTGL